MFHRKTVGARWLIVLFFSLQAVVAFVAFVRSDSMNRFGWQMFSRVAQVRELAVEQGGERISLWEQEWLRRSDLRVDEIQFECLCSKYEGDISFELLRRGKYEKQVFSCELFGKEL